jgi:inorganic pyrophosphatase
MNKRNQFSGDNMPSSPEPDPVNPILRSLNVLVENSQGSHGHYLLDPKTGYLGLELIFTEPLIYPANFGFIPKTLGRNARPLEMVLLTSVPIQPMALVRVEPLAAFTQVGSKTANDVIIGVAEIDPGLENLKSLRYLHDEVLPEIKLFCSTLAKLKRRPITCSETLSSHETSNLIRRGLLDYRKKFSTYKSKGRAERQILNTSLRRPSKESLH